MLICIGGRGYYQEWGKDAVEMTPGEETSNEWLEAVSDEDYGKLK
jgi:cellobiose phosphorylase